jgi:3-oxoacyl-[acyl-carrier protein] reductase
MKFLVTGAGSGFGRAIAERLASDGHDIVAVARTQADLDQLSSQFPDKIRTVSADVKDVHAMANLADQMVEWQPDGIVLNAGGPPVMQSLDVQPADWDSAWELIFKWKAELCRRLVPGMMERGFGRVLFIESQSVVKPIPGLVLSNAVRAAVVGYAKTLSREVARNGVTVNCILPGSHATPAIERVVKLRAKEQGVDVAVARSRMEEQIPVGRMGKAEELASLAAWLLSEDAAFTTGQAILHDGGL